MFVDSPGLIGMPNPLHSDGLVDYEEPRCTRFFSCFFRSSFFAPFSRQDGTPCAKSQMAKDVRSLSVRFMRPPAHDKQMLVLCFVRLVSFSDMSHWLAFHFRLSHDWSYIDHIPFFCQTLLPGGELPLLGRRTRTRRAEAHRPQGGDERCEKSSMASVILEVPSVYQGISRIDIASYCIRYVLRT